MAVERASFQEVAEDLRKTAKMPGNGKHLSNILTSLINEGRVVATIRHEKGKRIVAYVDASSLVGGKRASSGGA